MLKEYYRCYHSFVKDRLLNGRLLEAIILAEGKEMLRGRVVERRKVDLLCA